MVFPGSVLVFWEMHLVSGKCFDTSGNGLDSGKSFVFRGCLELLDSGNYILDSGKYFGFR